MIALPAPDSGIADAIKRAADAVTNPQSGTSPSTHGAAVLGPDALIAQNETRKRGRPAKNHPASPPAVSAVPAPRYLPEHGVLVFGAPFDLAATFTGCPYLPLDKDEQALIGPLGACVLNDWIPVDAKWFNLGLLAFAFIKLATVKALIFKQWRDVVLEKMRQEELSRAKTAGA